MNTNTPDIKFSKDELRNPDQITKSLREGFVWTTTHSKLVITLVAAFIVIGGGITFTQYLSDSKEIKMQTKYYSMEKAYIEKRRGFEEAAAEIKPPQEKGKKPAVVADLSKKATGDVQKDFGSIIASFDSLIGEAPHSNAAQMAALNISDIYLDYKKTDEALAALEKVKSGLNNSAATSAMIYMQMGQVYVNKNDCTSALTLFQKVADSKNFQFVHGEAKLRMGLCFETLNDSAKAEQFYAELAKKDEASGGSYMAISNEAGKFLRLLRAKKSL